MKTFCNESFFILFLASTISANILCSYITIIEPGNKIGSCQYLILQGAELSNTQIQPLFP